MQPVLKRLPENPNVLIKTNLPLIKFLFHDIPLSAYTASAHGGTTCITASKGLKPLDKQLTTADTQHTICWRKENPIFFGYSCIYPLAIRCNQPRRLLAIYQLTSTSAPKNCGFTQESTDPPTKSIYLTLWVNYMQVQEMMTLAPHPNQGRKWSKDLIQALKSNTVMITNINQLNILTK